MPLFETAIRENREVASDYFQMVFDWPSGIPRPLPGQFLTVRVGELPVPLLRRPFGFSGFAPARSGDTAAMIYWKRGPTTRILASMASGELVSIMAPLGRGFPAPAAERVPILVAGGVGIGPILFMANSLAAGHPAPVLLLGAKTAAGLPEVAVDPRVQLRTATDDGSAGLSGTVIDLLVRTIESTSGEAELYLCGPNAMLAAGHRVAADRGLAAWVSMEQTMGCGVGACMGCAVRVVGPDPYARVCTEGPVFPSTEIEW